MASVENSKTTFHALLKYSEVKINGVEINKANRAGITALHAACQRGNTVMINMLLKVKGINIHQKDKHGNTPLHLAFASGNISTIVWLCNKDIYQVGFTQKNKLGMHPFQIAVVEQNLEVVKMITTNSRVAKVKEHLLKAKENDGNTMFLLAVKSGSEDMVKFLLENGANIEDKNKNKANAFHLAADINSSEIIHMICKHCEEKYTQHVFIVKNLLEAKDADHLTPLHYSAKRNQKKVLTYLIHK